MNKYIKCNSKFNLTNVNEREEKDLPLKKQQKQ